MPVPRVYCTLALTLIAAGAAAEGKLAGALAVLRDEPALAAKVTLEERRITIGELLERITAATGVPLEADDRLGPISGYPVTVVVRDRGAGELLDALARTFTHPPDRWYWTRERKGGKRSYLLRHTLPLGEWLRRREAFIERFILEERRRTVAFLSLPSAQRARAAGSDPYLTGLNGKVPREQGAQSILGMLSDQDLRAVLRGETFRIPVSRLSPLQQEFVHKETTVHTRIEGAQPASEIVIRRGSGGEATIVIDFGDVGAKGALGGIWSAKALAARGREGWLGEEETKEAPDAPVPTPGVAADPGELPLPSLPHAELVFRAARLARMDVLLDAGRGPSTYGSAGPAPDRLPGLLHSLEGRNLLWKRYRGFYLFAPLDWEELDRNAATPWSVLKPLRVSAREHAGYLTPEDWETMAKLSRTQLEWLSEEFPDAAAVLRLQAVLRLANSLSDKERAAVGRAGGAGWEDWSRVTRERLLVLYPPEEAQRARIYLAWHPDRRPPEVSAFAGAGEARPLIIKFRPRRETPRQPLPRSR